MIKRNYNNIKIVYLILIISILGMDITYECINGDYTRMEKKKIKNQRGGDRNHAHMLYKSGWPQQLTNFTLSPTVGDLNGDGYFEIVACSGYQVYAWRHDGTILPGWPKNYAGSIPTLADLNQDGCLEIIVVRENHVYAWYYNGTDVNGWPVNIDGGGLYNPTPAIDDIDGDGDLEIVVATDSYSSGQDDFRGSVYIFHHNGTNVSGWPKIIDPVCTSSSSIALGDLDGDGGSEIVFSSYDGHIYAFYHNGTNVSGWPVKVWSKEHIKGVPSLGDLNGDGTLEIVVSSISFPYFSCGDNNTYVFKHNGTVASGWPIDIGPTLSTPSLGDIDGDGLIEIFVMGANISALHYNGTPVYGWTNEYHGRCPAIGDIDGNDDIEVISMYHGIGAGFHHDGTKIVDWPPKEEGGESESPLIPPISTPVICDLDGDGLTEIVANGNYHMYVWRTDSPYNPNNVPWPMFRNNYQHTGTLTINPPSIRLLCPNNVRTISPGQTAKYNIIVKNNLPTDEIINLSPSPLPLNWTVNFSNNFFGLRSGEFATIELSFAPPTNVIEDSYANITVTAMVEENQSIRASIITRTFLNVINNITLSPGKKSIEVIPGESIYSPITVRNNGNINDTIQLSVSQIPPKWNITFDTNHIFLNPLESVIVKLNITVPEFIEANKKIILNITAISLIDTTVVNSVNITIVVKPTPGIQLSCLESKQYTDPGNSALYTLMVFNHGNEEMDTIELSVFSDANWPVKLSDKIISLKAWESRNVNLTVTVPLNASVNMEGIVHIKGTSIQNNSVFSHLSITTVVNQIYNITLNITPMKNVTIPGNRINFTVTVSNRGNGPDKVNLSIVRLPRNWNSEIDKSPSDNLMIEIESGYNQTILLTINIPADATEGTYYVEMIAISTASEHKENLTIDVLRDTDNDGIPDPLDPDIDGDGWNNTLEIDLGTNIYDKTSFPPDMDDDGIPDSLDPDRDGDNILNVEDAYPDDPERWEKVEEEEYGIIVHILIGIIVVVFVVALVVLIIYIKRKKKDKETEEDKNDEFGRIEKKDEEIEEIS